MALEQKRSWISLAVFAAVLSVVAFLFATDRISLNGLRSSVLGISDTYEGVIDGVIAVELNVPHDITVAPGETFAIPISSKANAGRKIYGIAGRSTYDAGLKPQNFSSVLLKDMGSYFQDQNQYLLAIPASPIAQNSELLSFAAVAPDTEGELMIRSHLQLSIDFQTVDFPAVVTKVIVKKPVVAPPPAGQNSPPIADAGPPLNAITNELVMLDGSASSDPFGQPLLFAWVEKGQSPSAGDFTNNAKKTLKFQTAGSRTYVLHVRNSRNLESSIEKLINVNEPANKPPIVIIKAPTKIRTGAQIEIDSSESSDTDGTIVEITDELVSKPTGSRAWFANGMFYPDMQGRYVLRITAKDNRGGTGANEITINAYAFGACEFMDVTGLQTFVPDGRCDLFDLNVFIEAFGKSSNPPQP